MINDFIQDKKVTLKHLNDEFLLLENKWQQISKTLNFKKQTGASLEEIEKSEQELRKVEEDIANNKSAKEELIFEINRFKSFVIDKLVDKVNNALEEDTLAIKNKKIESLEVIIDFLNKELDYYVRMEKDIINSLSPSLEIKKQIDANEKKIADYEQSYVGGSGVLDTKTIEAIKNLRTINQKLNEEIHQKNKNLDYSERVEWITTKIHNLKYQIAIKKQRLNALRSMENNDFKEDLVDNYQGDPIAKNYAILEYQYYTLKDNQDIEELKPLLKGIEENLRKVKNPVVAVNNNGIRKTLSLVEFNIEVTELKSFLNSLRYDLDFLKSDKFDKRYIFLNAVNGGLLEYPFDEEKYRTYFDSESVNDYTLYLTNFNCYSDNKLYKEAFAEQAKEVLKAIINEYLTNNGLTSISYNDLEDEDTLRNAIGYLEEQININEKKYSEYLAIQNQANQVLNDIYNKVRSLLKQGDDLLKKYKVEEEQVEEKESTQEEPNEDKKEDTKIKVVDVSDVEEEKEDTTIAAENMEEEKTEIPFVPNIDDYLNTLNPNLNNEPLITSETVNKDIDPYASLWQGFTNAEEQPLEEEAEISRK